MRSSSNFLPVLLIGLFLAFSFNAYACVVPVFTKMPVTSGSDCNKPGKEPVTQFCDGFKTLAVQSGADASSAHPSNVVLTGNLFAVYSNPVITSQFLFTARSADLSPPRDIHVLNSVFRI